MKLTAYSIGAIMTLVTLVTGIAPTTMAATTQPITTACAPIDPKPTKQETRLGSIAIGTDILAVGESMTVVVKTTEASRQVILTPPINTEVVDYSPKNLEGIQVTSGKWVADTADVPIGEYSMILKSTHWTNGEWGQVNYSVTNVQGTGTGYDSYFSYYDTVDFTMAIDDRNQALQTTKQVVRKVTVEAPPSITVQLATNTGTIGTSVAEKRGSEASQTSPTNGKTTFYLTANEGDKVTLTASTPDTCSNSTESQDFTLGISDVARNYDPVTLLDFWWVGLLILLIIAGIIYAIIRKRNSGEPPTAPPAVPIVPDTQISAVAPVPAPTPPQMPAEPVPPTPVPTPPTPPTPAPMPAPVTTPPAAPTQPAAQPPAPTDQQPPIV